MWLKLPARQLFIIVLASLLLGVGIAGIVRYAQFAIQSFRATPVSGVSPIHSPTNKPSLADKSSSTNNPSSATNPSPTVQVSATAQPSSTTHTSSTNNQVGQTQNSTTASNPALSSNPVNSQTIQMYATSYGYADNDDGQGHFGTAVIAYPKSDGNPTLHNIATEGTGTYNDPITFAATVKDISAGVFPVGSIIYAAYLQKYFILEDQCADCGNDLQGMQYHIDFWMGPSSTSDKTALDNCESNITRNTNIMLKPPANLAVDTTPLFQNNQCTAHIH